MNSEIIIGILCCIFIGFLLLLRIRAIYRMAIAKKSSAILKQMSGRTDEGAPTIKDLQALVDYLQVVKEKKDKSDKEDEEKETNNVNRGMYS